MVTLRPRVLKKPEPQDIPVQKQKQNPSPLQKKKKQVSFSLQINEKVSRKRKWSSTNESGLPVGLRFNPTETELVGYYLNSRIDLGKKFQTDFVTECHDFYDTEPWVIWEEYASGESNKGDRTLYFFTRRKWRSENSTRFDRKVGSGTWSGQYARDVYDEEEDETVAIGVRREFKYESDREKLHNKAWLLQEYQISDEDEIVLCALRRNPRQLPPLAENKGSSSCAQKRKSKVNRPRVKRCKVEESSDEEEQGIIVDVPKTEQNPSELAQDHSMIQAMVPYEEPYGYQDCYYPELCVVEKPGSATTEELLAQYKACCEGSNSNSSEERTKDFMSVLFRL